MGISLYSDSYTKKPAGERLDIRFVGVIGGCYILSSRAQDSAEARKVFACRTQSISPTGTVLSAPVSGEVGEALTLKLDDFNIIRGRIERVFDGGFVVQFDGDDKDRAEIAAKIDWIKKHKFRSAPDKRAQKRVFPPHPRTTVTMPDGQVKECHVIDVSRSGAAVSADISPDIGTSMTVGKVTGQVVRHLEAGFAIKFERLLEFEELGQLFTRYQHTTD